MQLTPVEMRFYRQVGRKNVGTAWRCLRKSQWTESVITAPPEGGMNVCSKCHGVPSSNQPDIFLKTSKVADVVSSNCLYRIPRESIL